MLSAIDVGLSRRFSKFFNDQKISSQVTITYALILLVVMFVSNFFTSAGMQYLLHHQAARAIEISLDRITKNVATPKDLQSLEMTLSGVIVRVKDSHGNLIADNSPTFPATDRMLKHTVKDRPFFADEDCTLIETAHSFFYYREVSIEVGDEIFNIQVFKTITFEKELVSYMSIGSLILDLFGMAMVVAAGYLLIRKVLRPLKNVTEAARKISAGDTGRRLTVSHSNEVGELSTSFNSMLDKLQDTYTQQKKFISDASHELRTPLAVIGSYTNILSRFGANNKALFQESVTAICDETKNLTSMLDAMMFLAHADQGKQRLKKLPVDLEEILREVIKTFDNPRVEFFSDGNFEMIGDKDALKKMFAAILDNALKYSTDKVTIQLKIVGDMATIHIIDSGVGISAENQPKIFDRFFRVDEARTQTGNENSVGLGLSVAKWIADNHCVYFELDSELGRGTDFKCIIFN